MPHDTDQAAHTTTAIALDDIDIAILGTDRMHQFYIREIKCPAKVTCDTADILISHEQELAVGCSHLLDREHPIINLADNSADT